MKKSSKPVILLVLFYMVTVTLFILGYIGIKLKCEELTKRKVLTEQELENIRNHQLDLTAQQQALISEDRIVPIAENELGMINPDLGVPILNVDRDEIERISKLVKDKYE